MSAERLPDGGQDICLSHVVVMSGIRPAGRTVDQRPRGRSSHGFLYIWEGSASFYPEKGDKVCAGAGDLVLIPKDQRYIMRYTEDGTTFVLVNFEMTAPSGEKMTFSDRVRIVAQDK